MDKILMIVDKDIEVEKGIHIYKIDNKYSLQDKSNNLHTKSEYKVVYMIGRSILLLNNTSGILYNTVSKSIYTLENEESNDLDTKLIALDLAENLNIYLDFFARYNNTACALDISDNVLNFRTLKKEQNVISLYNSSNIILSCLIDNNNKYIINPLEFSVIEKENNVDYIFNKSETVQLYINNTLTNKMELLSKYCIHQKYNINNDIALININEHKCQNLFIYNKRLNKLISIYNLDRKAIIRNNMLGEVHFGLQVKNKNNPFIERELYTRIVDYISDKLRLSLNDEIYTIYDANTFESSNKFIVLKKDTFIGCIIQTVIKAYIIDYLTLETKEIYYNTVKNEYSYKGR